MLDDYPQFFKCKIYESFKPTNLANARDYIDYLIFNKNAEQFNKNTFVPTFPKDVHVNKR